MSRWVSFQLSVQLLDFILLVFGTVDDESVTSDICSVTRRVVKELPVLKEMTESPEIQASM